VKLFSYGLLRISPFAFSSINLNRYILVKSIFLNGNNSIQNNNFLIDEFENCWKDLEKYEETVIQNLSREKVFQNGLYFSGLLNNEKIKKRALSKYLTRVLFKTSPFSSFTLTGIVKLNKSSKFEKFQDINASYCLNGFLVQRIFKLLVDFELISGSLNLEFSINSNLLIDSKAGLVKLLRTQFFKEEIVTLKLDNTLNKILFELSEFKGSINDWLFQLGKIDSQLFNNDNSLTTFADLFYAGILVHELHCGHDEFNPILRLTEILKKNEIEDEKVSSIRFKLNEILYLFDYLNSLTINSIEINDSIAVLEEKVNQLLKLFEPKLLFDNVEKTVKLTTFSRNKLTTQRG